MSYLSQRYEKSNKLGIQLVFVIEGDEPDQKKDVTRVLRQQTKAKTEEEFKLFMKKYEDTPSEVTDTDNTKFESTLTKLVSRPGKITWLVVKWIFYRKLPSFIFSEIFS